MTQKYTDNDIRFNIADIKIIIQNPFSFSKVCFTKSYSGNLRKHCISTGKHDGIHEHKHYSY